MKRIVVALACAGVFVAAGTSGALAKVTMADVMQALPPGTVLLFDQAPPNPAPKNWTVCSVDATFVRIDQGNPGKPYAGKSATISGTTSEGGGDDNWHSDGGHNPPEATGTHHTHTFSVPLNAGAYEPTASNFACLHKVK